MEEQLDPTYEYNCPQFVDFSQALVEDPNAEEYFNIDHENRPGEQMELGFEEDEDAGSNSTYDSGNATSPSTVASEDSHRDPAPKPPGPPLQPTNLCVSLNDWHSKTTKSEQTDNSSQQPLRRSPRKRPTKEVTKVAATLEEPKCSKPRRPRSVDRAPPLTSKQPQTAKPGASLGSANEISSAEEIKAKPSRLRSVDKAVPVASKSKCDQGLPHTRSSSINPPKKMSSADLPSVSKLRRPRSMDRVSRSNASIPPKRNASLGTTEAAVSNVEESNKTCKAKKMPGKLKSSEDLQLENLENFKKKMAHARKLAEKSHKMALSATGYAPVRSKQTVTHAESFNFATDKRIKNHPMDTRKDTQEGTDFVTGLRKHPSSPVSQCESNTADSFDVKTGMPHLTLPQPFSFDRKRKIDHSDSGDAKPTYKTMAEQVASFSKKTPDRYHTKNSSKGPTPIKRRKTAETQLTIPKTPNLVTRGRHREVSVMSQAEIDQKELEEIKQYKFHANPVNEKILRNPNCGVKKVSKKPSTQPEEFEMEMERRVQQRLDCRDAAEMEEEYKFQAQPVSKAMLKGPVGLKPMKSLPLTQPESPAFALRSRLRAITKPVEPEPEPQAIKARQVPHTGIPFQPRLDHKITDIQPFSFEQRNRRMREKKEEMIQKVLEDEKKAREFRANQLPCQDQADALPERPAKAATKIEPFHLESDIRGAHRAEEWGHKQMEEELKQQRSAATFKANPPVSLLVEPFQPRKSTKPLTDINNFELNTARRKEDRAEFESYVSSKHQERNMFQQAREQERLAQEEHQVKVMRQQAVTRAQPIRHYKRVPERRSERPLTQPHTPNFSDRLRTRKERC